MRWTNRLIEKEKDRIRAAITASGQARLDQIKTLLNQEQGKSSAVAYLRRYILAISALVHHERAGGLTGKDVQRFVELAYAILKSQDIKPRTSKLSALYSDLHLIRSQIFRKEGDPWRAAWEQYAAKILGPPRGQTGFAWLGLANRSMRLGDPELALQQIQHGKHAGLSPSSHDRATLTEILACRLLGKIDETLPLLESLEQSTDPNIQTEISWLRLVQNCRRSRDFKPLFAACRRGQSHYQATYIIEASLWALTAPHRDYFASMPKPQSMVRNKTLRPRRLGAWYDITVAIHQAYDSAVPLELRYNQLAAALSRRKELLTIDMELLVLAAAGRWLARSKSPDFAKLVLYEYRGLSQRISNGASSDAFDLVTDLYQRPWFSV